MGIVGAAAAWGLSAVGVDIGIAGLGAVTVGAIAGEAASIATHEGGVTAQVMSKIIPPPRDLNTYKLPTAPTVTPPAVMPTVDQAAVIASQRLSLAQQMQRRGRNSTILTDSGSGGSDRLGGG